MPPVSVEVPVPPTVMRLPTLNDVDDAIGNMFASVVDVAVKKAAVGPEVAAILELVKK